MRRGTFRDETVDYAAVGATQASDLLQYPPERSIPAAEAWRLGSGEDRFRTAGEALLSWGAQRGAGLELEDVRPASGPSYSGVAFDAEGNAIAPSRREAEQRYDADGTPYVGAGTTVHVRGRVKGHRADAELRVIFCVEEARRIGFALGTVGGSVVSGEESFMIEWRDNDEVWFTVRAFDAPTAPLYRLLPPLVRRRRRELFRGYLRAISPLYTTSS
ncbi:DUF1990 domain-containing protein [Microbacterium sp. zg-Y818]|uniref:DUF1990 family protein n=2 Tax=Microbacterium TaxID=33882 RepID=UPI00214ABCC0|nr:MULTISPECIES: DUF1990 domain-containing protein [unclassified Microbacterium]MCR2800960.1 DUF1990 domain-containing protein [Microbacterium sp. zg.Y818]WIM23666.1 DUF1990 domain-containing protein [Microbacterium sp. zg-Y818]